MNKSELIAQVAESAGITQREAQKAVDAIIQDVTKALKTGHAVSLTGFGTFTVRKRAARRGRNPRTGEAISIKKGKALVFKPGRTLIQSVDPGTDDPGPSIEIE